MVALWGLLLPASERAKDMTQRKIAISSIIASWAAVIMAISLGFLIGKHIVVLIIFTAITAFSVTLCWANKLRKS